MGFDWFSEFRRGLPKVIPAILLVLLLIGIGYVFILSSGRNVEDVFNLMSAIEVNEVRIFVASFTIYAPLVFILLQISQAVIAPIPGFIFTIVGAIMFGIPLGAFYSIFGSTLGAIICFLLTRKYGRPFVEKKYTGSKLDSVDYFFNKRGFWITFVMRAIPVVSFGLISYIFGITKIKFKDYVLGTILGLIPVTLFYSYLGYIVLENPQISITMGIVMLVIFAFSPLVIPVIENMADNEMKKDGKLNENEKKEGSSL